MIEDFLTNLYNMLIAYLPKIIGALLALWVGFKVINLIGKGFYKLMTKKEVDVSLKDFLVKLARIALKVMLIVSVISMIGISTASFVAAIGAAGLAVGLALQGSLANFAGGVLILLIKPFRVGDYIEARGYSGSVNSIQIFHTVLKTPDNKTITLPNGPLANSEIMNYTLEDTRRIEFVFGISYGDDISKAKEIINNIINNDERVLKEPEPMIAVGALADSSVNINTRVWCKKEEYWNIYWDMFEKVKKEFDENGISIPFPQRDIHMINEK